MRGYTMGDMFFYFLTEGLAIFFPRKYRVAVSCTLYAAGITFFVVALAVYYFGISLSVILPNPLFLMLMAIAWFQAIIAWLVTVLYGGN